MNKILLRHLRAFVITAAAIGLVITSGSALRSADAKPRDVSGRFVKGKPGAAKPRKAPPLVGVLNINKATAAELTRLPGIGPSKADRIVAYRARRGPFRRVRDLRRVKGIGRKTVKRLEKHLAVKGTSTLR